MSKKIHTLQSIQKEEEEEEVRPPIPVKKGYRLIDDDSHHGGDEYDDSFDAHHGGDDFNTVIQSDAFQQELEASMKESLETYMASINAMTPEEKAIFTTPYEERMRHNEELFRPIIELLHKLTSYEKNEKKLLDYQITESVIDAYCKGNPIVDVMDNDIYGDVMNVLNSIRVKDERAIRLLERRR